MSIYYKDYHFTPWKYCYVEDDVVKNGFKFDDEGKVRREFGMRLGAGTDITVDESNEEITLPCGIDENNPYAWAANNLSIQPTGGFPSQFSAYLKFSVNFYDRANAYNPGLHFGYEASTAPTKEYIALTYQASPYYSYLIRAIGGSDGTKVLETTTISHNNNNIYEFKFEVSGTSMDTYYRINEIGDYTYFYTNSLSSPVSQYSLIRIANVNRDSSGIDATIKDFSFEYGNPCPAEFYVGESGQKYIHAGSGETFNKANFFAVGDGRLYSSIYESGVAESGEFSEPREWIDYNEIGNFPFGGDGYEYLYPKFYLSGDGVYLNLFVTEEVHNPMPSSGVPALKDDYLDTIDLFLRWENGFDMNTEGQYVGTNLAYYYSDDWHYEQSNGAFSTSESYVDLNFIGVSGERIVTTRENIPPEATYVRYTGWNNFGMKSARVDVAIEDIDEAFAQGGYGSLFVNYDYQKNDFIINTGSQNVGRKVFNSFNN